MAQGRGESCREREQGIETGSEGGRAEGCKEGAGNRDERANRARAIGMSEQTVRAHTRHIHIHIHTHTHTHTHTNEGANPSDRPTEREKSDSVTDVTGAYREERWEWRATGALEARSLLCRLEYHLWGQQCRSRRLMHTCVARFRV